MKTGTMKIITKQKDKSLGSFREHLSHVVSYIDLCVLQFPPVFKKGERSQTMSSTGYSKSIQYIHELTEIKPSKCALIVGTYQLKQ